MSRHHWIKLVTHYEHSSGWVIQPGRSGAPGWTLRRAGALVANPRQADGLWPSFEAAAAEAGKTDAAVGGGKLARWRP